MIYAKTQLQKQIENTTIGLHNTFEALLRTNINTYLRSKVETGSDLINRIISNPDTARFSEEEVIKTIADSLLSMQVGRTGYFYIIDSDGFFIFHPDKNLIGTNRKNESPINYQLENIEGYLEYEWKNTFEPRLKKKALFMTYIPEFDWILTATSYREEFTEMIDRGSIQNTVASIRFGESGYSYVVNRQGEIIAHPLFQNDSDNDLLSENDFETIINRLFLQKEGYITYQWKDDENSHFREKIVYGKYIEDFDWVVGTAIYSNEVNGHITVMFYINMIIVVIVALCLFLIVRKTGKNIEIPISDIYKTLELAIDGDLTVRTIPAGPVEIKALGENLNNFIETLKLRTNSLELTIDEKDFLLREIQHRTKNNLQTIISLLSLQTDFTDNNEAHTALVSTLNRVLAMAIVYDHMLLTDTDFRKDELALPGFLAKYVNTILSSANIDYSRFNISCEFADVYIKRNAAISIGLILNELLSYCLKNNNNTTTVVNIEISLKQIDALHLLFEISDKSSSFCPEKWNREDQKMAYILVDILTKQLSGLANHDDETCSYRIRFPFKT